MRLRFFLISVLFIAACGKSSVPGGNKNPAESLNAGGTKLSVQLVGEPSPNAYAAHLSWSGPSADNQKLYRSSSRTSRVMLKEFSPEAKTWLDADVVAGETYTYQIVGADTSNSISITIPKDLEFKVNADLESDAHGGRLFIARGVHLYTQGKASHLKFDEIISDDGFIESFPEGTTAAINQEGRSSGTIHISADRLRGKLTLVSRGENGGPGTPGQMGNKGLKGYPGTNCEYRCMHSADLNQCRSLESQGANPKQLYRCEKVATNGLPGGSGSTGGNGGQGRNGGDSGSPLVEINDVALENLLITLQEGKAGVGGIPGNGGLGGDGGDPGLEQHGICPAQRGPVGVNGPSGVQGIPGFPGAVQSYCLKTASTVKGNCR